MNESFGLFDTDQDGFISLKELQANLPKFDSDFSAKEIERIFLIPKSYKDFVFLLVDLDVRNNPRPAG